MKEKDIKEILDDKFESMAPDLVNKICENKIEKIKDESELFGNDEPLFRKNNKVIFGGIVTAMVACIMIVIMVFSPKQQFKEEKYAFSIIVDVNPSITVQFNKEGCVEKIVAGNKDAKLIVKKLRNKLNEKSKCEDVMNGIIKEISNEGYLKKNKNSMLVTVVSDNAKTRKEVLNSVQYNTEKYEIDKGKKFKTIYQDIKVDKKVEKVAKKNNVSLGKAALCIKLAEAGKEDYNKLCRKSINTLAGEVEKKGVANDDDELILNIEPAIVEEEISEPFTEEEITETISETESQETTSEYESEVTTAETSEVENTQEIETTQSQEIQTTLESETKQGVVK